MGSSTIYFAIACGLQQDILPGLQLMCTASAFAPTPPHQTAADVWQDSEGTAVRGDPDVRGTLMGTLIQGESLMGALM